MKHQDKGVEKRATFSIIKLMAHPGCKTTLSQGTEQSKTQGRFPVNQFQKKKRDWSRTTMTSSRNSLKILGLVLFASLGLTEQYIQSEITGYGTFFAWLYWAGKVLTQSSGFASSSNTLYTGAQGSENSASFQNPGDCATNIDVYPIGTLIYVVVSGSPKTHPPPSTKYMR